MGKGRRNQRNPNYYKVKGGAVEDSDIGRAAKQKLANQGQRGGKRGAPPAELIHPATPRRIAGPRQRKAPPKKPVAKRPKANAPTTFAGAALSRLGGVTRRVFAVAQSGVEALRWAGHMIEVARGRKQES